jgi:hypothetical protein
VSSREVDALVRERLRAGRPLYEVNEKPLVKLAPDVLIAQTHCEVCAVTPADVARRVPANLSRRQVVALRTGTLQGILEGFLDVADVIERREAGEKLVAEIRARLAITHGRVRLLPSPTIVCLEWMDPVFGMGNWGPEVVAGSGGTDLLGTSGEHSTAIDKLVELAAEKSRLRLRRLVSARWPARPDGPCGARVGDCLALAHTRDGLAGPEPRPSFTAGQVCGNITSPASLDGRASCPGM